MFAFGPPTFFLLNECIHAMFSCQTKTLSVLACVWYVLVLIPLWGIHAPLLQGQEDIMLSTGEAYTIKAVCSLVGWRSVWASRLLFEPSTRAALLSTDANSSCIHTFSPASLGDRHRRQSWGKTKHIT